jgi:hypothetical protein
MNMTANGDAGSMPLVGLASCCDQTAGVRSTIFMYVVNEKDPRFLEVTTKGNGGVEAQKALLKDYFQDAG